MALFINKPLSKALTTATLLASALLSTQSLAATPHIDAVETALRDLAPGSEGTVWQRTTGNDIAGYGPYKSDWLLQTPNCWGDALCQQASGAQVLADTIYRDISAAQHWVDITTLVTYPDGIFQKAIVDGISDALISNPNLTVRILGGTPPGLGNFSSPVTESAAAYVSRLKRDLGVQYNDANIIVAGVETSWLYSWNHSKIIAVDSKTAIVGGHNLWEGAYGDVANPISDVSMRLIGPASESAHVFADLLWDFACTWSTGVVNDTFYVDIERTPAMGNACPKTHSTVSTASQGNATVMALGGLGFGMDVPGGDRGGLTKANDSSADCSFLFKDYYNNDKSYTVANPEEEGLRTLIRSAQESVFISQQDLIAPCVPPVANAYYDARLFDVLADKLLQDVKVQIVTSTPGAKQSIVAPYSNMKKMSDITDILVRKVKSRGNLSSSNAKAKICQNLQLAPLRIASGVGTWSNGNSIGNHAKVISVDQAAFYVGSKNLYPATLQDFGYIVEETEAAKTFYEEYQTPLWFNSQSAAVVDYNQGICNL